MSDLEISRDRGVLRVQLNRPAKLNALTESMIRDLGAVFHESARRQEDKVIVLSGAGRGFCSGADLLELERLSGPGTAADNARVQFLDSATKMILAIHECPKPVIAQVAGVAAGGGCSMALTCDFIVASTDARFGQIFVNKGLALDLGASWLLPRLVGLHRARELAMLGDFIPAAEAASIGLIGQVVAPSGLSRAVETLCDRLLSSSELALSSIKAELNAGLHTDLSFALDVEARAQAVCLEAYVASGRS
jgi:enoyl-CoA hydratase/carnithine racemase